MSKKDDKLDPLEIVTPDIARAKAVKSLASGAGLKHSANRVLSNINSLKEIYRLNAQYLVGDQLKNFFGFMTDMANRELEMRASLRRKGVRGRDDVVSVVKEHVMGGIEGIGSKIRGFVSRE